ncbi:alpha/beta hydrolase fold domain-containing protein [Phenylobacterium sp. LjRoot225]|uniref:alpha/beta hydrolase fold domain-containing protein n=1 Tax=Phenylobacterium sp. LjRoot225 TaxID=3342285 RepID=UPI003ECDE479
MKAYRKPSNELRPFSPGLRSRLACAAAALAVSGLSAHGAGAQPAPPAGAQPGTIEADGTVNVPTFQLPPSIYLSDEAKAALPRKPSDPEEPMFRALASGSAGAMRAKIGQYMAGTIKHHADLYPVTMRETTIAGVQAIVVTPVKPVPAANRRKILLNLPGGGFVMGAAGGTGMVESIPLAALAQVEIVSITYRQAPETKFPAASEDVAAVYRELLKTHRPEDIAIFGCSAGGLLTAESMAWFQKEKLPLPGAIGIFCASADARWGGDSRAFGRPFQGLGPRPGGLSYFRDEDLTNPLASPVLAPDILKKFPPTLIVTATRAMEMSAAVNTHRELVKAGVEADLHMWDGLGHAFFYNIDLPESREAFQVMADFFRKRLKLQK